MVTVICNSGPLMALGKLNRLDLLASLYGEVQVPQGVYDEVVTYGIARGESDALTVRVFWQQHRWPIVKVSQAIRLAYTPGIALDPGETEVIALARSLSDPLVLLDDEAARSEARRLKLPLKGTLGVLVQAYRQNILSFPQVEFLIQEIIARPDIWISAKLCEQIVANLRTSGS